jgi:hypothetical protein
MKKNSTLGSEKTSTCGSVKDANEVNFDLNSTFEGLNEKSSANSKQMPFECKFSFFHLDFTIFRDTTTKL